MSSEQVLPMQINSGITKRSKTTTKKITIPSDSATGMKSTSIVIEMLVKTLKERLDDLQFCVDKKQRERIAIESNVVLLKAQEETLRYTVDDLTNRKLELEAIVGMYTKANYKLIVLSDEIKRLDAENTELKKQLSIKK